jgi:hypothetical protein
MIIKHVQAIVIQFAELGKTRILFVRQKDVAERFVVLNTLIRDQTLVDTVELSCDRIHMILSNMPACMRACFLDEIKLEKISTSGQIQISSNSC